MPDLTGPLTAERHPAAPDPEDEFGVLSLKVADRTGREYGVSMPYPEDGDVDAALRRLRDSLNVLAEGALDDA